MLFSHGISHLNGCYSYSIDSRKWAFLLAWPLKPLPTHPFIQSPNPTQPNPVHYCAYWVSNKTNELWVMGEVFWLLPIICTIVDMEINIQIINMLPKWSIHYADDLPLCHEYQKPNELDIPWCLYESNF